MWSIIYTSGCAIVCCCPSTPETVRNRGCCVPIHWGSSGNRHNNWMKGNILLISYAFLTCRGVWVSWYKCGDSAHTTHDTRQSQFVPASVRAIASTHTYREGGALSTSPEGFCSWFLIRSMLLVTLTGMITYNLFSFFLLFNYVCAERYTKATRRGTQYRRLILFWNGDCRRNTFMCKLG